MACSLILHVYTVQTHTHTHTINFHQHTHKHCWRCATFIQTFIVDEIKWFDIDSFDGISLCHYEIKTNTHPLACTEIINRKSSLSFPFIGHSISLCITHTYSVISNHIDLQKDSERKEARASGRKRDTHKDTELPKLSVYLTFIENKILLLLLLFNVSAFTQTDYNNNLRTTLLYT